MTPTSNLREPVAKTGRPPQDTGCVALSGRRQGILRPRVMQGDLGDARPAFLGRNQKNPLTARTPSVQIGL